MRPEFDAAATENPHRRPPRRRWRRSPCSGTRSAAGVRPSCARPDNPCDDRRAGASAALAELDASRGRPRPPTLLAVGRAEADSPDLFAAFLAARAGRRRWPRPSPARSSTPDVAKLGLKAVRSSVQDAKPLTDALTKAGGLTAARTDYTPAEVKAYVDEVVEQGRRRPRRSWSTAARTPPVSSCHAIAGAGGQVGPDMTSIGASAQVDYLVESILIPNKAVKEGYHALRVSTLDGKVVRRHQDPRGGRQAVPAHVRGQGDRHRREGHRREGPVAVAHARRAGRPAHPAGVRRPRAVPVRAGQGRPLRPEQGPPRSPLAGDRADAGEHLPAPAGTGGGGGRDAGRLRLVVGLLEGVRRIPARLAAEAGRCGTGRSRSAWSGPSST